MRDIKRQIEEKKRELKQLEELRAKMIKDKLLASLKAGNYYAITDDREWSNYRTLYICKFTGDNIYINKDLSSWKLHFDGPVIVKDIDLSECNVLKTSYKLSVNEEKYVYDELFIEPVDISEVKKILRTLIKDF